MRKHEFGYIHDCFLYSKITLVLAALWVLWVFTLENSTKAKQQRKEGRTFNWWGHKIDWQASSFPGHFSLKYFKLLANWMILSFVTTLTVSRMLLRISPWWVIRRNWFSWKHKFPTKKHWNLTQYSGLSRIIEPWNWITVHEGSLTRNNEFITGAISPVLKALWGNISRWPGFI